MTAATVGDYLDALQHELDAGELESEYARLVAETVLAQVREAQALAVPERWSFHDPRSGERFEPNLMQRHIACLMRDEHHVGNWSGAGSGKTASAVLSAMVVGARVIVVVCPNGPREGWVDTICNIDPQAIVLAPDSAAEVSRVRPDPQHQTWVVLNFEKLSSARSAMTKACVTAGMDFLIIDEVHLAKEREHTKVSERRKVLMGLRRHIGPEQWVLAMSATPVVNDISEGISLVELVTGTKPTDIGTKLTTTNLLALFRNLTNVGFRVRIQPKGTELVFVTPEVDISHLTSELLARGDYTPGELDAIVAGGLHDEVVRWAKECRARGKGLLVYTEFVTDIIEPLRARLLAEGLRVAEYSGVSKVPLSELGHYDVLIGTRAVGTGVDTIQHWTDTVLYVSLPWTHAAFEQSYSRAFRQGQSADKVTVVIPMGIIPTPTGAPWSWSRARWNRVESKRTVAEAAVDGRIPREHYASASRASKAAQAMLKRMMEGEPVELRVLDSPTSSDMDVEPLDEGNGAPRRRVSYGDFGTMNSRWQAMNSDTLHERLAADDTEWREYHRLYAEARGSWLVVPAHVIAEQVAEQVRELRGGDTWAVADLGCGEMLLRAKLHELLTPAQAKRLTVHGFDHVAVDPDDSNIFEVDLADAEFPQAYDAAVLSLALMGRNHERTLDAARAALRPGGMLMLADTATHLGTSRERLAEALRQRGFRLFEFEVHGPMTFAQAVRAGAVDEQPATSLFSKGA